VEGLACSECCKPFASHRRLGITCGNSSARSFVRIDRLSAAEFNPLQQEKRGLPEGKPPTQRRYYPALAAGPRASMGANPLAPSETNPVVGPYRDGLTPGKRSLTVVFNDHWNLLVRRRTKPPLRGRPIAPRRKERGSGSEGWRSDCRPEFQGTAGCLWAATVFGHAARRRRMPSSGKRLHVAATRSTHIGTTRRSRH
jgi:hypothetical protein